MSHNSQHCLIFFLLPFLTLFVHRDGDSGPEKSAGNDAETPLCSSGCRPSDGREVSLDSFLLINRKLFHSKKSQNTFWTENKGKKWPSVCSLAPNLKKKFIWVKYYILIGYMCRSARPQTDTAAWIRTPFILKGIVHLKIKNWELSMRFVRQNKSAA